MEWLTYRDKILGAWIGKSAGGIIGAKQENNKNFLHYHVGNVFPEVFPPNDDFDLQILWLYEALEKRGADIDSRVLANIFAAKNKCWANEYRIAIQNINTGIYPPDSGFFNNDFFLNSMGCPIRSEIWALVCPGNPTLAQHFAEMDGCIDHGEEAIEGEKFFAGLEAEAFILSDIPSLLENACNRISAAHKLTACVKEGMRLFAQKENLETARNRLVEKFGSSDASYSVINIGFTVLALLYGGGDFERTLLAAVNCGYDTDCTAATAGAILGIIAGYEALPAFWKRKIGSTFSAATVDVDPRRNRYSEVADVTARIGLQWIREEINSVFEISGADGVKTGIPVKHGRIRFEVQYVDAPEIGPGDRAKVNLIFINESGRRADYAFSVQSPAHLWAEGAPDRICMETGERVVLPLTVCCRKTERMPARNILKACLDGADGFCEPFGFMGKAYIRLFGPYFDTYDPDRYSSDPYGEVQQKNPDGEPDLFAMFNGFVNIARKYRNEDEFLTENCGFCTGNQLLPIEEQVGYVGPACVYLAIDFICEFEREIVFLLGNNDAYRFWINGKMISASDCSCRWTPVNDMKNCILQRGKNHIVIKTLRKNAPFAFSYMISALGGQEVFVDCDYLY